MNDAEQRVFLCRIEIGRLDQNPLNDGAILTFPRNDFACAERKPSRLLGHVS